MSYVESKAINYGHYVPCLCFLIFLSIGAFVLYLCEMKFVVRGFYSLILHHCLAPLLKGQYIDILTSVWQLPGDS